jgi:RNA polymerase sigma factor (sigma-70 family)
MTIATPYATAEPVSDEALLRRFVDRREADAFTALAERHAGLVYRTCLRITADRHDAEELAQDCFLQLARKASTVRSSVAAWLHQLATHRSLNAVRSRGRRRAHEARSAVGRPVEVEPVEASWREIEPLLDEAVDALPDGVRDAIILHFLKNLPQGEVAGLLGVHQSTVSRRVSEGLKLLHERLQASGVVFSTTPLAVLLATHAAPSESTNLAVSLGKIALAGAGSNAAGKAAAWLGFSLSQLKAWCCLAGAVSVPLLVQLVVGGWHGFFAGILMIVYIAWRQPAWIEDISFAPGQSVYENPFYPWRRWTWTTPPRNWRGTLAASLAAAAMLGGMSWGIAQGPNPAPGVSALMSVYALVSMSTAVRIIFRVFRCKPDGEPAEATAESVPAPDLADVIQTHAAAAASVLMTACLALLHVRLQSPPKAALGMTLPMAVCSAWAIIEAVRMTTRFRRPEAAADGMRAEPPKPRSWILIYSVLHGVLFTAAPLAEALVSRSDAGSPQGMMRHEGTLGMLPPLALLMLTFTIRPLVRGRRTTHSASRLFAVAVIALCALVDLGLCIAWFVPRS